MRSFDWEFEDLRLNAFMGTPHEGDDDDDDDDGSGMVGEEGELLVVSERSLSEGLLLTRLPSLEENDEVSEVMMEEDVSAQKPQPSSEDPHAAGLEVGHSPQPHLASSREWLDQQSYIYHMDLPWRDISLPYQCYYCPHLSFYGVVDVY